jgi:hypothetical protein
MEQPPVEVKIDRKASAKSCPRCGLLNPPSASRCDCGFDLDSQRPEGMRARSLTAARRTVALGIAIMALSAFLTAVTWVSAHGRATYVFYGMIISGAVVFWRGCVARSRLLR